MWQHEHFHLPSCPGALYDSVGCSLNRALVTVGGTGEPAVVPSGILRRWSCPKQQVAGSAQCRSTAPGPSDTGAWVASGHRLHSCARATEHLCVPRLDYKAGLGQRKGKNRTEHRSSSLEGEFTRHCGFKIVVIFQTPLY